MGLESMDKNRQSEGSIQDLIEVVNALNERTDALLKQRDSASAIADAEEAGERHGQTETSYRVAAALAMLILVPWLTWLSISVIEIKTNLATQNTSSRNNITVREHVSIEQRLRQEWQQDIIQALETLQGNDNDR